MNRVIEKLSSMYLSMWILVFLIVWTGIGLYMAGADSYINDFQVMNDMHIREWLMSDRTGSGFLKPWFLILCAAMTALGINLIFCSWSKIFKIMRAKFNGRQFYMLIVHALFGFVALGHLGGLLLGFEHNNIELGAGETYSSEEGYELEVKDVHFVGDVKALKKAKRYITRDDLNRKESFVEISISRNSELLKTDKVYLLKPLRYEDVQVTVNRFLSPENKKKSTDFDTGGRIILSLSKNPVLKMFLTVYPVMIAGILIYLVITWRKPHLNRNNVSC